MARRFTFEWWNKSTYIQFDDDTSPGKQYDIVQHDNGSISYEFICEANSHDNIWGRLQLVLNCKSCIEVDEKCNPIPQFERDVFSPYDFI